MTEPNTALAVIGNQEFAIMASGPSVEEIIKTTLGSETVKISDLEQLRIPAGGGLNWDFSNGPVREFFGVIVGNRMGRAFWQGEYTGGNNPPDCSSNDCVQGGGDPGGDCLICPFSRWESDPKGGRGQACKQGRMLLIIVPGSILPVVLRLPPTSLTEARQYFVRSVICNRKREWEVLTKFTLKKVDNGKVPVYSQVVMELTVQLSPGQCTFFQQVRDSFAPTVAEAAAEDAIARESNDKAPAENVGSTAQSEELPV